MNKRVLIADDAAFMRKIIRQTLEPAGYEIVGEARNGLMAIKKYRELQPDVVTLDINIDHLDGLGTLQQIMREDPSAVCVMCSAMSQPDVVADALNLGARDYVVKPFDADRLLQAVGKSIENAEYAELLKLSTP